MKKSLALIISASTLGLAVPAAAQDTDSTFTGPRVEGIVGYDVSRAGSSIDDEFNEDNDQSIEGLLYGVAVGYDFAAGGALIGVEGEYSRSTADVDVEDGDVENFGLGNVDTGRDLYVGLRAGVLAGESALVYVKGGYTNTKYNLRSATGTTEFVTDLDADGYRLGAGAEYAMSENSFIKLEYRYSNYSEGEIDFPDDFPDSDRIDLDTDRHQVVVGYGFRF
ncbi:hypothetical protein HME9302_01428 [Alteripontixanthobacter maritimus]|uniref:Outer membrane protein beta-barrel domain-containing protein n=1 Tax=Alteripontixanthobacter maritimus TaxID=2161824 RepID=A0A369QAG0_9SPHN|nr:porin family protein [Alteripontixanthobacter maritimus]RDC60227.1 hypothetical protein HME9302_01428 [Alteripontixanthobacter maritimus]